MTRLIRGNCMRDDFNSIFTSFNGFIDMFEGIDKPINRVKEDIELSGNNESMYSFSLPGVSRDDISLSYVGRTLTLRVQQSVRNTFVSDFTKRWTLSELHDETKITARLLNGVLTITLPLYARKSESKEAVNIVIK